MKLGDEGNCSGAISIPRATEGLVSKHFPPSHLMVAILNTKFNVMMIINFETDDFF